MPRPRRIKANKPRLGYSKSMTERADLAGGVELEFYANEKYGRQDCAIITYLYAEPLAIFQTNIQDIEQLLADFKKLRGIKRVRKQSAQKG